MNKTRIGRGLAALLALIMLCCFALPCYAVTRYVDADDFMIEMGDGEEVDTDMQITLGDEVDVYVYHLDGYDDDYDYDWSVGDEDELDFTVVRNTNGQEIELTGLEECTRTRLYLTISRTGYEDADFVIDVKVVANAKAISLSHKSLAIVSFTDSISSIDLTSSSYILEYRVFQAIYNKCKNFSINYPLDKDNYLTYLIDGEEMDSIDPSDFSKKVNLSANTANLSRTIRNKLEEHAKNAGCSSFRYGDDYYPLYLSATNLPTEATVIIDLDAISDRSNDWADMADDGELYLYYYDTTKNTLTENDSIDLYRTNRDDIQFTTDEGGYYIFSTKALTGKTTSSTTTPSSSAVAASSAVTSSTTNYVPIPDTADNRMIILAISILMLTFIGATISKKAIK